MDFRVAGLEEIVDFRGVVVVAEGVEGVAAACRFGAIAEVCCCCCWVWGWMVVFDKCRWVPVVTMSGNKVDSRRKRSNWQWCWRR